MKQFIKLYMDYMGLPFIQELKEYPGGYETITTYIELLLLACKRDGYIICNPGFEPYKEIGHWINESPNVVGTAIAMCKRFGKIKEIVDEHGTLTAYYMVEFDIMTEPNRTSFLDTAPVIKSAPKSNYERLKNSRAKKWCKEHGLPLISDSNNKKYYNGLYFIKLKENHSLCECCGCTVAEPLRIIKLKEIPETTADLQTICSVCYQKQQKLLPTKSNETMITNDNVMITNDNEMITLSNVSHPMITNDNEMITRDNVVITNDNKKISSKHPENADKTSVHGYDNEIHRNKSIEISNTNTNNNNNNNRLRENELNSKEKELLEFYKTLYPVVYEDTPGKIRLLAQYPLKLAFTALALARKANKNVGYAIGIAKRKHTNQEIKESTKQAEQADYLAEWEGVDDTKL